MGFKIDGEYGYIDSADMSANITGDPINLASHLGIALQCDFSGVPSGVIKIQASCDLTQDEGSVINWTNIYELDVAGAGNKIFNCRNIYYKWIRLVYEATAGSGTLAVNYTVKGEW
jgi:hypothetical protein